MIPDLHSRRFDPRWLLPVIGTDGASCSVSRRFPLVRGRAPWNDPAGMHFDEALEQFDEVLLSKS